MRSMTLAIVGAVLLFISPLESQAPVQAPVDARTAVQRTLIDLYRAVSEGDAARYRALCTREFQRLERSELTNVDRAIASFTSDTNRESLRSDRLDFRGTRIVGNTAAVVYVRTSTLKRDGKVEQSTWQESAQLLRSAGRWRVSLLHSTPLEVTPKEPTTPSKAKEPLPAWTKSLPVSPGESLKNIVEDGRDKQVATFFQLSEMREIDSKIFISGSGYIEIKGGGTYYSGSNRAQDPFIELTITSPDSPMLQECRDLFTEENLLKNAIAIGGEGYFTSMPGIKGRGLGIVRLDSVTRCELVPRR